MASEAMSYERELAAALRNTARQPQVPAPPTQAKIEEPTQLESKEEEAWAARRNEAGLVARRRLATRGKGGEGEEKNVVGAITEFAGEVGDLFTAIAEIEIVVPALALLANYHVRFISGNLGLLPEAGGPLSYFLDKCMEVASAGAKTAAKTAGKSAAGAGVGMGSMFEVKKLAIWQIFLGIVVDVLLVFFAMVNFLIMIAVPLLILAAAGGLVFGFCTSFPDVCTSIGGVLGVTI